VFILSAQIQITTTLQLHTTTMAATLPPPQSHQTIAPPHRISSITFTKSPNQSIHRAPAIYHSHSTTIITWLPHFTVHHPIARAPFLTKFVLFSPTQAQAVSFAAALPLYPITISSTAPSTSPISTSRHHHHSNTPNRQAHHHKITNSAITVSPSTSSISIFPAIPIATEQPNSS
jgi:hypothetical protein